MHFYSYELCVKSKSEMYSRPVDLRRVYAHNNKFIPYRELSSRKFLVSKLCFERLLMYLLLTNMIRCFRVKSNEK